MNNQDSVHNTETAGPLEEISFWRFRTIDLSGINEQLRAPEVVTILKFLAAAKSTYLEPFNKLSTMIQHGCEEANDNLKFLSVLTESCEELAQAKPKNIPSLLPKLLQYIRSKRTSTNVALSVKESTNVALFSWAHSDWLLYSTHAEWAQGPF